MWYVVFFAILWGILCGEMADSRGRSPLIGFVVGAFLGIFGAFAYLIIGDTPEKKKEKAEKLLRGIQNKIK